MRFCGIFAVCLLTLRKMYHTLTTDYVSGDRNAKSNPPTIRRSYVDIPARHQKHSGPALGMFEVFVRTGPPILGGRQFCQTQVVDDASVCSFVVTPLVVLDILTNTHDYWLIQYCTVLCNMWRSVLRCEPRWGA